MEAKEPKPMPKPPVERDPKDSKHGETKVKWQDPAYLEDLEAYKAETAPKQVKKKG